MSREETIFGERWPYSKAKSALLRSASNVMREGGPRAATLKNIAGKAGVTEPAIFRHFDGVDGLFESLFKVVELFFDEFQLFYKAEGLLGLDRLENAYFNVIELLKENEDYCYLVVNPDPIFRQYQALRDRLVELKTRDRQTILDCLKEAKAKGQLQQGVDLESAAYSFVGSALLVMQAWAAAPDAIDPGKECRKLWNGIRAIVATPAHAKSAKPFVKALPKQADKHEAAPVAKAPAKAKAAKTAKKQTAVKTEAPAKADKAPKTAKTVKATAAKEREATKAAPKASPKSVAAKKDSKKKSAGEKPAPKATKKK